MRNILYATIVACFLLGGYLDARTGEWKLATTAFLFAAANAVIFFWRT